MHSNYINKLLNIKGVIVKKIENFNSNVVFHLETKQSEQVCPCCGGVTTKIHDYHTQSIKDLPLQYKHVLLVLKKRRYVCKCCGKKFYERLDFLPKYYRMTNRLVAWVYDELLKLKSVTSIASEVNVSPPTVTRIINTFSYSNTTLPEVLSIDEFKGNSGGKKYHVILVDSINRKVIDVLPTRYLHDLCSYFKRFSYKERCKVKYFLTDLYENYKDVAITYFPNAKIVADRFHYSRYAQIALDNVRIRVQKSLPKEESKKMKNCKRLLASRTFKLEDKSKEKLIFILNNFHDDLRTTYRHKEWLYEILQEFHGDDGKNELKNWISSALESHIPELAECAKTFSNWFREICNSFYVPYSNGPTEGLNNKIKTLKRVCFGMRNFNNFRTRILLACG